MHIDKYLCDIKQPIFPPGPFYVKLKYDLKQAIFDKKPHSYAHLVYCTAIVCLIIICTLLIYKPDTARNLNTLVFGNDTDTLEMLLLASETTNTPFPSQFRSVSSDATYYLPFIEEDKPYLIQRVKDSDDKSFYYVREVKQTQHQSKIY